MIYTYKAVTLMLWGRRRTQSVRSIASFDAEQTSKAGERAHRENKDPVKCSERQP